MLEQGGAALVAKESLEKGKDDNEVLAFAARLIGNMTYDHGIIIIINNMNCVNDENDRR